MRERQSKLKERHWHDGIVHARLYSNNCAACVIFMRRVGGYFTRLMSDGCLMKALSLPFSQDPFRCLRNTPSSTTAKMLLGHSEVYPLCVWIVGLEGPRQLSYFKSNKCEKKLLINALSLHHLSSGRSSVCALRISFTLYLLVVCIVQVPVCTMSSDAKITQSTGTPDTVVKGMTHALIN